MHLVHIKTKVHGTWQTIADTLLAGRLVWDLQPHGGAGGTNCWPEAPWGEGGLRVGGPGGAFGWGGGGGGVQGGDWDGWCGGEVACPKGQALVNHRLP